MRQFNIDEGVGHPIRQDDLEFMFEAQEQAIKGLMSAYNLGSRDSFIISGCKVVHNSANGTYDVSAGWFCYKGEIMKVDAHQVSDSGSAYVWAVVETNPTSKLSGNSLTNPLTYEDGSTVYAYKERKIEYQIDGSQSEKVADSKTFYINGTNGFIQPTLTSGSHNSSYPLLYRIYGGYLHIFGQVDSLTLTNTITKLFDLPAYFHQYNVYDDIKDLNYFDPNPYGLGVVSVRNNLEVHAWTYDGNGNSYTGSLNVNAYFPVEYRRP